MKERPILFSGAMVRALLDGSKTQTRRPLYVLTKSKNACFDQRYPISDLAGLSISQTWTLSNWRGAQPGDRLWVRESFFQSELEGTEIVCGEIVPSARTVISYAADRYEVAPGKKRPSIHMPRWGSRITLEIDSVRVERLHAMSDEDALAEGIRQVGEHDGAPIYWFEPVTEAKCGMGSPLEAFANLWREINGDASWNSNPWVCVVEFKRVTP